ncbi:hypothetical protein BgiMline_020681 [Biomphalaria glabrata]|nr:hypothetical protein BgiMline_017870 [Biomphalaria glabrata]
MDSGNFFGDSETQISEGGEADMHRHFIDCDKNPGHVEFVPIDDFHLENLPEGYRDNDLLVFMRALAGLTVRVDVKVASARRPHFWSDTDVVYPFSHLKERRVWRTGSGRVCDVRKFQSGLAQSGSSREGSCAVCRCTKCQHSESPSKLWWEYAVSTATHVVFDDVEASHVTCRLFYDNKDSPMVTLNGFSVENASIQNDRCKMVCTSCDVNLGSKLDQMVGHFKDAWLKVRDKFIKTRDFDKLTLIVSHPHGCSKQISVGHWVDKHRVGNEEDLKKFTYTTCTCPGSSGAPIYLVGFSWKGSVYHLVHCGASKSGLNYSGAGYIT